MYTILLFLSLFSILNAEPIKVIITGHTLAGKTSVINELQKRGYYVVEETATQLMLEEYAKLDEAYPENAPHKSPHQIGQLQSKIFAAQKKAYKKALADCQKHPPKNNLIIFDRAVFDTYVYSKIFYPEGTFSAEEKATFEKIVEKAHPNYAKSVIFAQIVPKEYYHGTLSNTARHESYEQSCFIGEHIRTTYALLGFTLHTIDFAETISQKTDAVEAILLTIKEQP